MQTGRFWLHIHQYPVQSTHLHPHDCRSHLSPPGECIGNPPSCATSDTKGPLQKHPISPVTYWVERHSALAFPVAWGLAFLHAGAWWAHAGWGPSGPICYYAPKIVLNNLDSRDLVQFIPRAFVFITIIVLYSMLYKFLRRPDTIQLSSQFVSGEARPADSGDRTKRKGLFATLMKKQKKHAAADQGQNGDGHSASNIDPNAPWEQLEFVQIGGRNPLLTSRSGLPSSPTASFNAHDAMRSNPDSRPASPPFVHPSTSSGTPELLMPGHHRPSLASVFTTNTEILTPPYEAHTQRPSESTLVYTPELRYHSHTHSLSPVMSQNEVKSDGRIDRDIELDLGQDVMGDLTTPTSEDELDDKPLGQTMKEFFDNDHAATRAEGHLSQAERGGTSGNAAAPQMSATAYFNRQASLLMLYFPLAVSLARPRLPGSKISLTSISTCSSSQCRSFG